MIPHPKESAPDDRPHEAEETDYCCPICDDRWFDADDEEG